MQDNSEQDNRIMTPEEQQTYYALLHDMVDVVVQECGVVEVVKYPTPFKIKAARELRVFEVLHEIEEQCEND